MVNNNSETLKAINELNKSQKQANNVNLSDNVSSFLGKPLEKAMSGREATSYKSNTNFNLANDIAHNNSYNNLLNSINDINESNRNQNTEYVPLQLSSNLISYLSGPLKEITMQGDPLPNNGFSRLQPYDEWEANFNLYESVNIPVPEYNSSKNKPDTNTEINRLNTFDNPISKVPEKLKNAVVKAIMYVSKSEYISGNDIADAENFKLFTASFNPDDLKKWYIAKSLGQDALSEEDYKKLTSGYNARSEASKSNEETILNRQYTAEIPEDDKDLKRVLNANIAALRGPGNLSGSDVLSDKIQKLENIWDNSGGNWWFSSNKGSHNISEVIYSLYKSADGEFSAGSLFGDEGQVSPGFDKWSNNTASQLNAGGLNSKSTIGLVTDYLFDFKNGYSTRGNKLRAGTVIGYRNYAASGRATTDYISVSPTVIPGGSEFNAKNKFSYGRGVALKNRIDKSLERHVSNNYAIQAIYDSGPDFMANMFDMCIFTYKRNSLENVNNAEIFASFNIRPNIPYNASNPNGKSKQPHEYKDKMPISQKELFGSNKTGKRSLDDFLTRVQSISIPEIRASTTEIKVLNQTLTKPIPLLENDFTSSFTIEQDAGLEYMRLFNRLSGLSLMMEVNGEIPSSYNSKYGHYNNLQINKANAGNLSDGAGSFGIAIKLKTMHESRMPKISYIVFEGVKFLGGGQVSFKSGSVGLATYTQKFIYKNVGTMTIDNPSISNAADKAKVISHTGTWATLGKDENNKMPISKSPMLDNGYINPARFG